ncbi:MAG: hypothetical protein SPD11_01250 [Sphaerochaetaceae bacterium]|nr:hypothetical protein [Sphaerochaetaceae bacterium]
MAKSSETGQYEQYGLLNMTTAGPAEPLSRQNQTKEKAASARSESRDSAPARPCLKRRNNERFFRV